MFTPIIDLEVLNKATVLRFSDVTGVDTGDGTKWDGVGGLSTLIVTAATLTATDPNGDSETIDVAALINAAWPVIHDEDIAFTNIDGEWVDGYYTVVYNIWITATAITAIADYSGTVAGTIAITSVAHNVLTGMKVTISGTTSYDGFYDATYIDANTYYVVATFVADEAGTSTPCYSNTYSPFVFANIEMAITKMFANFCNMDEGPEADDYMKQTQLAYGLLLSLRSALMTTTVARINNIYARILRILDYNSIELTYT